MSQNSRNQSFSYYFCLMIKGSGSIPLTEARIRNHCQKYYDTVLQQHTTRVSVIRIDLKGPKHEIFVAEFFTQFKPVWVDD